MLSCFFRSVLSSFAISGTSGSSGLGSEKREQMERRTLLMVRAGDLQERNNKKRSRKHEQRQTNDSYALFAHFSCWLVRALFLLLLLFVWLVLCVSDQLSLRMSKQ